MIEEELIDVYDENRIKTGKIINRKDKNKLNENEYTVTVHCWIINSKKEILITQRNLNLNRGGMWEDTHGGVKAGETSIEGMKRELKEELGIEIEENELIFVKTLKRKNIFRDCYVILKDIPLDYINFNDNEVMNCKYVSIEKFKKIIKNGESTITDFSQTIFNYIDINNLKKENNLNVKIIHDPKQATGLAVIIDVFRAFTVEPYLIYNGVEKLIPVGNKELAYKLKEKNKEYILLGERNGIKLPSFDYGNSPSQIKNIDFSKKTVVHTTSCGTQGIVNAINADEIITGSLVNANAIVKYIKQNNFKDISIVSMSRPNELPSAEDELCAKYIKSLLEDNLLDNFKNEIEKLKLTSGKKFFDSNNEESFPKEDFYLCIEIDKFDFVLRVNKDINGMFYIEKVEI